MTAGYAHCGPSKPHRARAPRRQRRERQVFPLVDLASSWKCSLTRPVEIAGRVTTSFSSDSTALRGCAIVPTEASSGDVDPRATIRRMWSAYRRAQHKWYVRWGTNLLVLGGILLGVTAWQTRNLVPSGELAPVLALPDLEGRTWKLDDLRGKKVVLTFWAPWCTVCAAETPTISSLRSSVGDSAHVLSVALAYGAIRDVHRFVREHQVDYPVLLGDDEVMRRFRIDAFPTTYVLSEDGRIEDATVGYTTGFGLRWRLWL
jgi:thiol-disulfide isomerase/thioredoxin